MPIHSCCGIPGHDFGTLEVQEDPRLLEVVPGNLESRTSPE